MRRVGCRKKYGGDVLVQWSWMLKRGAWEVPVAGSRSETVWNGFFFRRVYGAIYVVKGKMMRRTPIDRLTEGHMRVGG